MRPFYDAHGLAQQVPRPKMSVKWRPGPSPSRWRPHYGRHLGHGRGCRRATPAGSRRHPTLPPRRGPLPLPLIDGIQRRVSSCSVRFRWGSARLPSGLSVAIDEKYRGAPPRGWRRLSIKLHGAAVFRLHACAACLPASCLRCELLPHFPRPHRSPPPRYTSAPSLASALRQLFRPPPPPPCAFLLLIPPLPPLLVSHLAFPVTFSACTLDFWCTDFAFWDGVQSLKTASHRGTLSTGTLAFWDAGCRVWRSTD